MKIYDTDNFESAQKYLADDEISIVKPGQWVISHGMFGMYYKPTSNGFLWKVIEVIEKTSRWEYLKAICECPTTKERSKLSLSMLYILPEEPDKEFIEAYNKAHEEWLNKELIETYNKVYDEE